MHKNILTVVGITILFLGMSVTPSIAVDTVKKPIMPISNGKTLYVGGTGEGNYTKIQDAIDNASDGDTVFVYDDSSPYYEKVVVDESIYLIGEDKNTTIIEGSDDYSYAVNIYADWVNISGFTVISSYSWWGIILLDSRNNNISDNIILYNFYGIDLSNSSKNTIIGNTIITCAGGAYGFGIRLSESNNNTIMGNIITSCIEWDGNGIRLSESNNNTISNNNISDNEGGIYISSSSNNIIKNNNFSGNWVSIESHNSDNNTIKDNNYSNNQHDIILEDYCINNIITGNTFSNVKCCVCICIRDSDNNIVANNIIHSVPGGNGILIQYSKGNTIIGNTIKNLKWQSCIYLWSSTDNTILCNNLICCNTGINSSYKKDVKDYSILNVNTKCKNNYIDKILNNHFCIKRVYSCNDNIIHHNNFFNNTQNAYDECSNEWDNGYPSGGNYWDDYNGTDDNGDGIGDTPYNISGGYNQDRYPLMEPWGDNLIPIAKFTWSPYLLEPGETVLFNASESIDYDGNIILYEWDWDNDGEYDENHTSPTATHTFEEAGYYPVTLQVTDNDNLTDSKTKTVRVGNHPPDAPTIDGPTGGAVGTELAYTFVITDSDGDDGICLIYWGDNNTEWIGYYSGIKVTVNHSWSEKGVYTIIARAIDVHNAESELSELIVTISNSPDTPEIDGKTSGKVGKEYEYTFNATDPDGDDVKYFINWGDNNTEWTDFNASGTDVKVKHTWSYKGDYTITSKAQDIYGAEGPEGTLTITMPKNKAFNFNFKLLECLLNRFPLLEVFLRAMNLLK